ncbi:hypothetical protein [Cupriavidus sp. AU9028]|uniref:hypothetical protein n=1 Tax=Cupriavidus sp. AU9028 TaxID=2871157 RepID=UPI001C952684|nr:hypothetical protein [Cupriavidus sp. AU9028]MBY4895826.1 hypothetical protein [Cupriavidus sp. AU9028]
MLKAPHLIPHLCQSLRLGLRRHAGESGTAAVHAEPARPPAVPAASRSSHGRPAATRTKHPGLPVLLALILVSLVALAVFLYLSDGLTPAVQSAGDGDWSGQHHLLRYLR